MRTASYQMKTISSNVYNNSETHSLFTEWVFFIAYTLKKFTKDLCNCLTEKGKPSASWGPQLRSKVFSLELSRVLLDSFEYGRGKAVGSYLSLHREILKWWDSLVTEVDSELIHFFPFMRKRHSLALCLPPNHKGEANDHILT